MISGPTLHRKQVTKSLVWHYCFILEFLVNSFPPGKFFMLFCSLPIFSSKSTFYIFFKEYLLNIKQIGSRSGQIFFVGPNLGPNCLKRLSADDIQWATKKLLLAGKGSFFFLNHRINVFARYLCQSSKIFCIWHQTLKHQ